VKSKTLWHTQISKFIEIEKGLWTYSIPNKCLRHLPRRPMVDLTHLFNHCLWLSHFPKPWKEAKVMTLPKHGKATKFPQNLCLINFLFTIGKLFREVILKIVQRYIEEACFMQVSLVSMPVIARHLNLWGLRTRSPKISKKCLWLQYS
jgi:hypothetical protein